MNLGFFLTTNLLNPGSKAIAIDKKVGLRVPGNLLLIGRCRPGRGQCQVWQDLALRDNVDSMNFPKQRIHSSIVSGSRWNLNPQPQSAPLTAAQYSASTLGRIQTPPPHHPSHPTATNTTLISASTSAAPVVPV